MGTGEALGLDLEAELKAHRPPGGVHDGVHEDSANRPALPSGEGSSQVNFAVVNFAVGNFAEAPGVCVVHFVDTPRNAVVCRALQTRWSLATGTNFAEDPGFCVGDFAANLKRESSHTKLTAPETPPPPV